MSQDRTKLIEDAIRLRGLKTAREIGAMHGVSRCVVIGLWFRAGLRAMPMKTRGRLVARGQNIAGYKHSWIKNANRQRPERLSSMPSKATLAVTPPSEPDWWTEMYLTDGAKI